MSDFNEAKPYAKIFYLVFSYDMIFDIRNFHVYSLRLDLLICHYFFYTKKQNAITKQIAISPSALFNIILNSFLGKMDVVSSL